MHIYKEVAITENAALEKERDKLLDECEVVMELMRKMAQDDARSAQDQVDYKAKYGSMSKRYE